MVDWDATIESAKERADKDQSWEKLDVEKKQNGTQNKLEQQKIDLSKQQLQLQQQHQATQQLLVVGGLSLSGVLVLVVSIYILTKVFKKNKPASKANRKLK